MVFYTVKRVIAIFAGRFLVDKPAEILNSGTVQAHRLFQIMAM